MNAETPGTALVAQRERLITQAPSAMFDTAAFEHLNRVATVLFRSGLVPKSLTHYRDGNEEKELPESMVVARCVLLADQAQRSGADVLAYIQSTSIINGRLMHEGKLVNAIVRQRIGVTLRYRFGLWDTDHISFPPKDDDGSFLHNAGERLAVRVFDRDCPEDYVEGSVGMWKPSRKDSPWASVGNWPRQLRYRGVREWARAYDPGSMLGMIADGDEDLDDVLHVEAKPVGLMQRLKGTQEGDGFDKEAVEAQTEPTPKRRGRPPKNREGDGGADQKASPHNPTADASEGHVNETPENEHVEGDMNTKEANPLHVIAEECAADQGIPEHMRDDVAPASVEEAREEMSQISTADEERPTETASAPPAEAEPDTSETADPALTDGQEASASGQSDPAEDQTERGADPAVSDDRPPELIAYVDAIETAAEWKQVIQATQTLYRTDFFRQLPASRQNDLRAHTWINLKEINNFALPDILDDFSAFRFWIETEESPQALRDNFDVLTRQDLWRSNPQFHGAIRSAVDARLEALDEMAAREG